METRDWDAKGSARSGSPSLAARPTLSSFRSSPSRFRRNRFAHRSQRGEAAWSNEVCHALEIGIPRWFGAMTTKAIVPFDPAMFLATAGEGRTKAEYLAGVVIFSQGDASDAVFHIVRGKIKIAATSGQGREGVVGLFGDGDFFGEGCLIGQPVRLAAAIAMTDSEVVRIGKAEMIRALHAEPDLAEMFTTYLLTRNSRVEADLVDHLFNSSERRLARVLLLLANFGKEGKPEPITTKISQETLAEMIGTTRPRVSFFMNKFRKLGYIDYNGEIKVHSSLLSVLLHEDAPSV